VLPDGLKINTDGAFQAENHTGGWGFTIRNEHGMLMAAGAGQLEHVSDALHSESLAMLHDVNAVFQLRCNRIMVETDSIVLKQAVTTYAYDLS
jgi:ribonuclease HI